MASEHDDTVFDRDIDDDDDMSSQSLDDEDVLEEDEEDSNAVTIAVPSSSVTVNNPNGSDLTPVTPLETVADVQRHRIESVVSEGKKPQLDESRRGLFQRLWTDEDEIELLQGFFDYTAQRGTNHHDTALFYDQIKSKLQLDFNKNQLVEKLRRLKKKYRNVLNKISSGKEFSFKSPHDQATFEISRRIWSATGKIGAEDGNMDDDDGGGNVNVNVNLNDGDVVKIEDHRSTPKSRKRPRPRVSNVKIEESKRMVSDGFMVGGDVVNNSIGVVHNGLNVSGLIEETVRSCVSPLFKELLGNAASGSSHSARGIGGLAMNAMPLSFGGGEMMADERWRKQQILELEVYSKRLELVQEQIRAQLEELRSMGGG